MRFKNFKIKIKIIVIVIIAILISVGAVGGYAIYSSIHQGHENISAYETELMNETQQKLIDLVDSVYTMVVKIHSQAVSIEGIKKRYGPKSDSFYDCDHYLTHPCGVLLG